MPGRQRLVIELDIYGADDAPADQVGEALGFVRGEAAGFDDLDGYDSDLLHYEVMGVRWW